MGNKITIGQYIPGEDWIHKLDPRVKIALTFVFLIAIFFIESFWLFIPVVVYIAAIVAICRIPFGTLLRGLRPILFIVILTFFLNLLTTEGEILFQWGFLKVTKEGLIRSSFVSIRLVLLVLGTSLMTLTTSPTELTDGLESIMSPLKAIKFPAHELAMMISIALRFIPTLFEESEKIMKAQMARGADFESGNIFNRAKNMIPLLVPLFINSFRRAGELATAMEARCYRGGEGRTRLNPLKMTAKDTVTLLLGTLFFVGLASWRFIA